MRARPPCWIDGPSPCRRTYHYLAIVQEILKANGVDVNANDNHGKTSLSYALKADSDPQIGPLLNLLEAGADPNATANKMTPLFHAINAEKLVVDDGDATPLPMACGFVRLDIVQALIRCYKLDKERKCRSAKVGGHETTLDQLLRVAARRQEEEEATTNAILLFRLISYAEMLIHRHGLHCIHSLFQATTVT